MSPAHQLVREGRGWRCGSCGAGWTRPPKSTCLNHGQRLYRRWTDVPADLATATMLRRAGLVLPKGTRPVAVVEDTFHVRYVLYPRSLAAPKRQRTERQREAFRLVRSRLGTCARCGERPGREALIRQRHYLSFCKEAAEDRLCVTCYTATWNAEQEADLRCERARYREMLPTLAVIDFETTGLTNPAAVEVAVWGARGLLYLSLLDPGPTACWEADATAVHGLSPAHVAGAKSWPAVEAELLTVLAKEGVVHLAAWGGFDRNVVYCERGRHGQEGSWPVTWVNLMDVHDIQLARERPRWWRRQGPRHGSPPMTSLARACRRYQVPPGCHRAKEDAEAAYRIFLAMTAEETR